MSSRISVFGRLRNIDLVMVQREGMSLHLPHEFSPLSLDMREELETLMKKTGFYSLLYIMKLGGWKFRTSLSSL